MTVDTEFKTLYFPFFNGGHVKILFKRFSPTSNWICEMSDEFITDLEDALADLEDEE